MENNTVILSLDRYHELQNFEKAVNERKAYIVFTDWQTGQKIIYLSDNSKIYDDLFKENQDNKIELVNLKGQLNTQKKIDTKKWWQIW